MAAGNSKYLLTQENRPGRQIQDYLQQTRIRLGLLVNFREKFVKPIRIVCIDSEKLS